MSIDLRGLITSMSTPLRGALETAAARCVAEKRPEVGLEHLLLALLDDATSDVAAAMKVLAIDHVRLRAELEAAAAPGRGEREGRPTFAQPLLAALDHAATRGHHDFGWTRLRSLALLIVLVREGSRFTTPLVATRLGAFAHKSLEAELIARTHGTEEGVEARGGSESARQAFRARGASPAEDTQAALLEHFAAEGFVVTDVATPPGLAQLDVHLRVHICRPTAERPCILAFTSGMSDRPQATAHGAGRWRHLELMMLLPPDWPGLMAGSSRSTEGATGGWVLQWLEAVARFAHEERRFIGPYHLFPSEEPLGETRFTGILLLDPVRVRWDVAGPRGRAISVLALVPLYAEEIALKRTHGIEELLRRMERFGVTELVEPDRVNVGLPAAADA